MANMRCCSYLQPVPVGGGKTFEKYEVIIDG
jgi:hypothetical protein